MTPSKAHRYLSWSLLGALSVFFAEVVSGSDMFPFFHPWGLLVVFPLYTLHLLVLGTLAFRRGHPSFITLFAAGAMFGLYEAYITKVLWDPPWGAAFKVGGIAPFETVLLVFFWHPFMSLILPLVVGETLLSSSSRILDGFPFKVRRLFQSNVWVYLLAAAGGVFQSINSPSLGHSLLSAISTIGVLWLLSAAWKRLTQAKVYLLADLLPSRSEFRLLLIALAAMYVGLGVLLRPDALPGIGPQLLVWMLYAVFLAMFYLALRRNRPTSRPNDVDALTSPARPWLKIALAYTASAALSEGLLSPLANPLALLGLISMIVLGLVVFLWSSRTLFQPFVPRAS